MYRDCIVNENKTVKHRAILCLSRVDIPTAIFSLPLYSGIFFMVPVVI